MPRLHLFEFNDQAWLPEVLREGMIESLSRALRLGRVYDRIPFAAFARRLGADRALDLCSGAGEPAAILGRGTGVRFTLSDLFPNVAAFEALAARAGVDFVAEPVDATAVPDRLDHPIRTVVSAFHHFRPGLARGILAAAVRDGKAVFIVEGFPRSLLRYAAILPALFAGGTVNPFLAERGRLAKFLLTFVVPLIPVLGMFDGLVSALRIHSRAELEAMVADLPGDYVWEYGTAPYPPWGRATWFAGLPRAMTREA